MPELPRFSKNVSTLIEINRRTETSPDVGDADTGRRSVSLNENANERKVTVREMSQADRALGRAIRYAANHRCVLCTEYFIVLSEPLRRSRWLSV